MAQKAEAAQLKLAEKLVILNDRSLGLLTRVYNVKKACADAKSRPRFLQEKALESALAHIVKKFPQVDIKRNSSAFANVGALKADILKSLSLYYYTFVELLELKDHILQLLTLMDANQIFLDISLNYDLTAGFLNLVSNFVALMVLLGRIEDRKAILGLYNAAWDLSHQRSENAFPRLGQMVLDYDNPLKKLAEDFSPINRLVQAALRSLHDIYMRRNISADQMRNAGMMSLIANTQQMVFAAQTSTVACEYLSLETMERWIVFGTTVCHGALFQDQHVMQMFHKALENTLSVRLFRDEPLLVFPWLIAFFEQHKGASKRVQELKQMAQDAQSTCAIFHAHRRQFVRAALKEMCLLLKDRPGLLGPKILFVWMGLSLARDEVLWLLRHADLVHVNKKLRLALEKVVTDRCLPELLCCMVELRALVLQHQDVIINYYREFMFGYDAVALRELLRAEPDLLPSLGEHEAVLLKSFVDSVAQVGDNDVSLAGLRLDWFRLQASLSVRRSNAQLREHRELASLLNTTVFHTKMMDILPEMLKECSDLSIYCFYPAQFDAHVEAALNFTPQARYTIAFAHLAEHFAGACHDMCPEERDHVVERGILSANAVLEKLAAQTARLFDEMAREEYLLAEQTTPRSCAQMIAVNYQYQTAEEKKPGSSTSAPNSYIQMPGFESHRQAQSATELTDLEKKHLFLVELCRALAHSPLLDISEHRFSPKAFLHPQLEAAFMRNLVQFARPDKSAVPRRPSEVLVYLRSQTAALQRVDDCLNIGVARLFTDALLQQSQHQDSFGNPTIAQIYLNFYLDLLHRTSLGQIMFSEHLKTFVPTDETGAQCDYAPEQFTDARELRALCQLISPYGVKYISERLIALVASQIVELVKTVRQKPQRELLKQARVSFAHPDRMRELLNALADPSLAPAVLQNGAGGVAKRSAVMQSNMSLHSSGSSNAGGSSSNSLSASAAQGSAAPTESVLQRVMIIGEICVFRDALHDALHHVLQRRMPFLLNSLEDLSASASAEVRLQIAEACAAAGLRQLVDQGLVNLLRLKMGFPQGKPQRTPELQEHYEVCCLIMVFVAIALPKLAANKQSFYKASLCAAENNCHTVASAIATIGGALFSLHDNDDVDARMREFLALCSRALLQMPAGAEGEAARLQRSLYVVLEQIVNASPWLNFNLLESCFPYALIRSAYLNNYRAEPCSAGVQAGAANGR